LIRLSSKFGFQGGSFLKRATRHLFHQGKMQRI
jgi:hypothetical protein